MYTSSFPNKVVVGIVRLLIGFMKGLSVSGG